MYALRLLAATALALAMQAADADPVRIRLGALAPRGTEWHRSMLEIGEKWRAAEGPGAEFIVYGGGSQGGEADMVRRMRVGQLNAAMLTVIGLTEIDASVGALQKMPLVFRSWEELDYVREKLRPSLDQRFLERGFVVLCWGDAGWVRFFSKGPAHRPEDYRRMKIFAWAGDAPQTDIMKSLGYQPVALEVSDILPALQTGMVSMVPTITPISAKRLVMSEVRKNASGMPIASRPSSWRKAASDRVTATKPFQLLMVARQIRSTPAAPSVRTIPTGFCRSIPYRCGPRV